MSNALVPVDYTQLPTATVGTYEQHEDLSKGATFLGRLQLYTKGTAINKGLILPGHYGIPEADGKIADLGTEIDLVPFARRPKAMDMSDKQAILTNYDPQSPEFDRIRKKAGESESNCMFGTSFLVFERSTGRFLEMFFGTASTRPISGEVAPFMQLTEADIAGMQERGLKVDGLEPHGPLPMTLKVRLAESKKGYSWHVPVVQKCSVPFTNLPPIEKIVERMLAFATDTGDGVEKVEEPQGKKQRAR